VTRRPADPRAPEQGGRTRIIAVANQKGGVGKSTTAVSLGAALAEIGHRVLVVDLDPQGNASTGLGIRHDAREVTVYDVLSADAPVREAIIETPVESLFAVPSTIDLAGAEIELVSQFSREMRLRKALEPLKASQPDGFDFVLLDCPPSLGLLTINALAAAEELIVPIQCEYYALEGLGQLLRNVRLVQQNVNPGLRLTGIVMTMFDPRTKLSEQVVDEVRKYFGELVYRTIIPRTVRLSEAPGFGQPITVYDPRSRGAECYRDLAREVADRLPSDAALPSFDELPTVVVEPIEPGPAPAKAPRPIREAVAQDEVAPEPASEEVPAAVASGEDTEADAEGEAGGDGRAEAIVAAPEAMPADEPVAPVEPEPILDGEVSGDEPTPEPVGGPSIEPSSGGPPEEPPPDVIVIDEWKDAAPEEARDEVEDEHAEAGRRRWGLFRRGGKR
jgi:chromosome partitioning protein